MEEESGLSQEIIDEFVSAAHGDIDRVRDMLGQRPDLLNANAAWQETPIQAAAQTGRVDIATLLLDAGAPLDICTAAMMGMRDKVAGMLDSDPALARTAGAHGIPALYFPAIKGHMDIAEQLLSHGADVNAGAGGNTPLHGAAAFGETRMAAWLLEHGADPNALDYGGKTPLDVANEGSQVEVAALLSGR